MIALSFTVAELADPNTAGLIAPRAAATIEELRTKLKAAEDALSETHVDDFGLAWSRPTAYGYFTACKARDTWEVRAITAEAALKAAEDAHEATGQRLLKLTPSGSEYFNRKGDGYVVDHEACLQVIETNRHRSLEWAHKCKDRDDKITDLEAALKAKDAELERVRGAASKILHWADTHFNKATGKTEGMVVSAEAVRGLWDALASPPPAGRTGEV